MKKKSLQDLVIFMVIKLQKSLKKIILTHFESRCGHDRMVVGFTTIYAIKGRCGRDHMIVRFITTYANSAYYH